VQAHASHTPPLFFPRINGLLHCCAIPAILRPFALSSCFAGSCSCPFASLIKERPLQASLQGAFLYYVCFIRSLYGHLCSSDQVILVLFEYFYEVCGEAGYTDNKVFVVIRILLSIS